MHSVWKQFNTSKKKVCNLRRLISSKVLQDLDIKKIRNLGILAHIDAGKTTTTERMLFYSGLIQQPGEVHHGNTVTDYMTQERERGITIRSASVSLYWQKHQFNLIDTPGHIDFTMEVEQTLNVLDGAVVILDGSAGVEAQTLTVWRQGDRYAIPRFVFVNKMDRIDSSCSLCCQSIEEKLHMPTLSLQLQVTDKGKFVGVVDLIGMQKITYDGQQNKQIQRIDLTESNTPKLWEQAMAARATVIDKLSSFDDDLANIIISKDSLDNLESSDIKKAIKQTVLNDKAVPVLMGSAYKNIGIEPLMDAVISYLPNPLERNKQFAHFDSDLCARAFKVIHDKQKGPLVFFRLYNGVFTKGQKVYNIQQDKSEQSGKLYVAYADDYVEMEKVKNGNIAVVSGLKETVSGNLVTNSSTSLQRAKKKILSSKGKKHEVVDDSFESLFGVSAKVPEPVFFCSVEPPSLAYQTALERALHQLQREDPSLRVKHDSETGQTILAGMGELHLEIIKDRIVKEHNIDVELGPLQIAYREAPTNSVKDKLFTETRIGSTKQSVNLILSLIATELESTDIKEILRLDKTQEAASNIASIFPKHLLAIRHGIEVALTHGPKLNSQVVNAAVMLHWLDVGRGTSETVITATTTQLVQKLLRESGSYILEPIMNLEIAVPEEYMSGVMSDLNRRRAIIQNISVRGTNKVVYANAPLAELFGYSTFLRTITSGTAVFSMEFFEYQRMTSADEEKAIQSVRGF